MKGHIVSGFFGCMWVVSQSDTLHVNALVFHIVYAAGCYGSINKESNLIINA